MTSSGTEKTLYVCIACGMCCTWHGYVRMTDAEIDCMAAYLGMPADRFIEKYMTLTHDRRGLTLCEKANGHCLFFEETGRCAVYPVRPKQCRDFPNKWNFSGFRNECRSVRLRYRVNRIERPFCANAYFP